MEELKTHLEQAWENGFFHNLRYGTFNESQYIKLKKSFEEFSLESESDKIDKRFVTLIWFAPLFVKWQEERLIKSGINKEKVDEIANYFYGQCEEILGLP